MINESPNNPFNTRSMDIINEGRNGNIVNWKEGIVRKILKRQQDSGLPIFQQKEIHKIAEDILQSMNILNLVNDQSIDPSYQWNKILRTPLLRNDPIISGYYLMEKINMDKPLWLGDPITLTQYDKKFILTLTNELQRFWQSMWNHGYAAWDFELYLQPDGTVVLLDFDKFGKRLLTNVDSNIVEPSIHMPFKTDIGNWFFDTICFPYGFENEFSHTILDHFNPSRISYT